jgi:ribosome recycling factor
MSVDDHLLEAEDRMEKIVEHLRNELRTVRTGRASSGLVEHIRVDYYGAPTELRSLANITVPDPLVIAIKPYDASSIGDIVKAIQTSDIGITPHSDGKIVRLQVPTLSQERRRQLVSQIKDMSEETRVKLRNARRDLIKEIDAAQKAKEATEDEADKGKVEATELVHKYEKLVDAALEGKTKEIMES